jgi:hypothetical protein
VPDGCVKGPGRNGQPRSSGGRATARSGLFRIPGGLVNVSAQHDADPRTFHHSHVARSYCRSVSPMPLGQRGTVAFELTVTHSLLAPGGTSGRASAATPQRDSRKTDRTPNTHAKVASVLAMRAAWSWSNMETSKTDRCIALACCTRISARALFCCVPRVEGHGRPPARPRQPARPPPCWKQSCSTAMMMPRSGSQAHAASSWRTRCRALQPLF